MSEKWWALKDKSGNFRCDQVFDDKKRAEEFNETIFDRPVRREVVPIRIVEEGGPCEWEAERWDVYRIVGEYKTCCLGMRYCPMCGRSLEDQ